MITSRIIKSGKRFVIELANSFERKTIKGVSAETESALNFFLGREKNRIFDYWNENGNYSVMLADRNDARYGYIIKEEIAFYAEHV